ncbi:MAG TPA: response regulator transcription factor [Stackebrandtia sp.]|jgi:DNA-binding NarL/FixJ family response regulator|uniref:response regulator transcription factor n=1 Tax=Stackebrandtia sp. TaxID=2023065 RepID=UPI002D6CBDD6|nr:response regulator transcription factor [Stackebrandtia sp.]HZE39390.1 response regulator transcription factor [Stackebrandtia sp.]
MRVILAEDSTLLREGLAHLLADEGHQVVGSFGDAEQLLSAVSALNPDVVVVDVRMPPTHTDEGLSAALDIRATHPTVGVLVLSQYVERRLAVRLMESSVAGVGYLLKDRVAQVEDFLDALRRVATGGSAFDPEVVRRLVARTSHADPLSTLTAREREVLSAMASGHTNAAIAAQSHVSESAVEKHVRSIFAKLGLNDSATYSRRVVAVLRYLES